MISLKSLSDKLQSLEALSETLQTPELSKSQIFNQILNLFHPVEQLSRDTFGNIYCPACKNNFEEIHDNRVCNCFYCPFCGALLRINDSHVFTFIDIYKNRD